MSKQSEKAKKMIEMRRKQIEDALKFGFCRKCKTPLTEEDKARIRKEMFLPLCPKCDILMKEEYKRCQPLMQKLNLR